MIQASNDGLCPQRWAEQEFGGARLGDQRRVARLMQIAAAFAAQPTASIPKACTGWKQTKGAYRFFSHPQIRSKDLIAPHQEQTRQRIGQEPVVLVVQDTTGLKFSSPAQLGLLGSGPEGVPGLWLHSSLAFTPEGQALGIVQVGELATGSAAVGQGRAQTPAGHGREGKSAVAQQPSGVCCIGQRFAHDAPGQCGRSRRGPVCVV